MKQFLLTILLIVLCLTNIFTGSVDIPFTETLHILSGQDNGINPSWSYIILQSRLPQMLTALLCGAGLATAGLLLQTAFLNPLAGPSILGIDSGANMAVAIVMMLAGGTITMMGTTLGGYFLVILAAMTGAMVIMVIIASLSTLLKNPVMLLVTGVMISYITSSFISLLQFHTTEHGLQAFTFWGMGGFTGVTLERLPVFAGLMSVCLVLSILHIKPLDAILLGDAYAQNLGINTQHMNRRLFLIAGLITATSTAFCGPISFVGLATPHISRMLCRTATHRTLIPTTMLLGACICLLCNQLCTLPSSTTLPINTITPLFGVPVILWVILKGNRE